MAIASFLRSKRFTAHTAFDGAEAVDTAKSQKPDVVLLDIGARHAGDHGHRLVSFWMSLYEVKRRFADGDYGWDCYELLHKHFPRTRTGHKTANSPHHESYLT